MRTTGTRFRELLNFTAGNARGFTIVELVVVVGILTILLSIATMQFNSYSTKSAIESQTRTVLTDLVAVRNEALFQKRRRAVKLTSTSFWVYSSAATTGTPVQRKTLRHPVLLAGLPDPLVFNGRGIIEGIDSGAICIEPAGNAGVIDSIVLGTTHLQTGKRNGTECQIDDIETR